MRLKLVLLTVLLIAAFLAGGTTIYAAESDPSTWPIVYQDNFEDPTSGWATGETESVASAYVDGGYQIQVKDARQIACLIPGGQKFANFAAEAKVQTLEGTGAFGFIFRYMNKDNFYCFMVSTNGYWEMEKVENGQWKTLVDWTHIIGFNAAEIGPFKLALTAQGNQFTFRVGTIQLSAFIDTKPQWEFVDDTFQTGQIALCVDAFDKQGIDVRFNDFVIHEPPSKASNPQPPSFLPQLLIHSPQEHGVIAEQSRSIVMPYLPLIDTELLPSYPEAPIFPFPKVLVSETGEQITDPKPHSLAIADVDGDGKQEIIMADGEHPVLYMYRAQKMEAYDLGLAARWHDVVAIATGDLDGDEKDDVAIYLGQLGEGGVILILQCNSRGQVARRDEIISTLHLGGLTIADMNDDGLNDLVTGIGVYYQSSSHGFGSLSPYPGNYRFKTTSVADVEIADLDGDGLLDVARSFVEEPANPYAMRYTGCEVLYQTQEGCFSLPTSYRYELTRVPELKGAPGPVGANPYAHLATGDVTGDEKADLVLCVGTDLYVLAQNNGSLQEPVKYTGLELPRSPLIADIDADGRNDVVVLDGWEQVSVLFQEKDGRLYTPATFAISTAQIPGPQTLLATDISGDGQLDLVTIANYEHGLSVLSHATLIAPAHDTRKVEGSCSYWNSVFTDARDPFTQSLASIKLGLLQFTSGGYEQALSYFKKAAHSVEEAKATFSWEAYLMLLEGDTYYYLGLTSKSLSAWDKAYTLSTKMGYVQESRLALSRLGLQHFLLRNYETALYYWHECFEDDQRLKRELAMAADENNMGLAYMLLGESQQSMDWLATAFKSSWRLGREVGKAIAFGNAGILLGMSEAYDDAIECFCRAQDVLKNASSQQVSILSIPDLAWILEFNLGIVNECSGKLDGAIEHYRRAIDVIESIRSEMTEETFRLAFQQKVRIVYERLIILLDQMGQEMSAFSYAERCRARTFLDLLAMGPVGTLENVAEEGIRSGVVEPSAIKADVAEVAGSLPSNTAALEYFVTDDATYVWVIYQGEIQGPIQLPHGRAELMHKVIETREQLGSSPKHPFNPRNLVELYNWVIRPVEHLLPETTGEGDVPHLIIIPSGPLYYLPFQALIWTSEDLTENAPFIARYALSYSPSLATLKYAQALADTAYPQATFLALADPDSGDPRLPDAQTEARMVAQLFTVSSVHVDSDATEDVVQSDSATAREILLSTHGLFNPHNPLYSYLVVSPTAENKDAKLFAHEVFSLPLHADIVVLSACETLLPSLEQMIDQLNKIARRAGDDTQQELTEDQLKELTAGDEVVGLTRAFISAGSSSVLSSLWSVPSGATSQLMVSFYKHREEGMNKSQALRAAQLEVMNTTGWTQPWYWAAFNLMGDWR